MILYKNILYDFKHSKRDPLKTKISKMLVGLEFGFDDNMRGKGDSGKIQDAVTLVSCEYAH